MGRPSRKTPSPGLDTKFPLAQQDLYDNLPLRHPHVGLLQRARADPDFLLPTRPAQNTATDRSAVPPRAGFRRAGQCRDRLASPQDQGRRYSRHSNGFELHRPSADGTREPELELLGRRLPRNGHCARGLGQSLHNLESGHHGAVSGQDARAGRGCVQHGLAGREERGVGAERSDCEFGDAGAEWEGGG